MNLTGLLRSLHGRCRACGGAVRDAGGDGPGTGLGTASAPAHFDPETGGGPPLHRLVPPLSGLCPACAAGLALRERGFCPGCGRIYADASSEPYLCAECRTKPRPWGEAVFHGVYEGLLRGLILDYKLHARLGAGRLLQDMLLRAWLARGLPAPDIVVPVPLHPRKLIRRGYNQSLELARAVGRGLGVPVEAGALTRLRDTPSQAGLSARRRSENVRGAFEAWEVRKKRVLLVDDVMTTGQTLFQCAKALRCAGASGVDVLVLARALAG